MELHTLTTPEPKVHRAVRAGGVSISLREMRRELYIPCTMTSNNTEWEWGWLYLRNNEPALHWKGPEGEGQFLVARRVALFAPGQAGVSLAGAEGLADAGLGAASVLANLHHRRIIPLMERRLRIFEMEDTADPVALAQSRLLPNPLQQEYAATRARCAINLKAVRHGNNDLWSFVMLPHGPRVSGIFVFSPVICLRRAGKV
jgi:hypothetical protein